MVDRKSDIEARMRTTVRVPPTEAAWEEIVERSRHLWEVPTPEPAARARWMVPVAAGLIAALGITAAWTASHRGSYDGTLFAVAGEPGSASSSDTTVDDPIGIDGPTKVDFDAEVPTVQELEQLHRSALSCLDQAGFTTFGPAPLSDGRGFDYRVSSPPGGPILDPTNTCEAPLFSATLAFSERSLADQRLEVVAKFNELARCVGVDKSIEATRMTVGSLEPDPVAEGEIFDAIMAGRGLKCIAEGN